MGAAARLTEGLQMVKIDIKPFIYCDPPPGLHVPRGPTAIRAAFIAHMERERRRILQALARRRE